jgi:hypothetical protein
VRTYPDTGELLWEDRIGTADVDDLASSVAITDTQVSRCRQRLACYDVQAGTLLWEIPDEATGLVVARENRVVVTG